MERTITSLEELQSFAVEFIAELKPLETHAAVIALKGDLGVGKTTFTQMVARQLGVTETVSSPTFVIMKKYLIQHAQFKTLVHVDAYRLEGEGELAKLKFQDELANPNNLIIIEWPEMVADELPENVQTIEFTWVDETTRKIKTYE